MKPRKPWQTVWKETILPMVLGVGIGLLPLLVATIVKCHKSS